MYFWSCWRNIMKVLWWQVSLVGAILWPQVSLGAFHPDQGSHPHPFPVLMMVRVILMWHEQKDTMHNKFLGSLSEGCNEREVVVTKEMTFSSGRHHVIRSASSLLTLPKEKWRNTGSWSLGNSIIFTMNKRGTILWDTKILWLIF